MSSGLSPQDKDLIRTYVTDGETDEEQRRRREECAHEFGVSIGVVRAVTAWSKIYASRAKKAADVPRETASADVPGETVTAENEMASELLGGEHVNYDNAVKNKWRDKMKEFIAQHMPASERFAAKVLCLPGKECLEIPMYLDLGFHPENITGVEGGDDAARETFSRNAERYGIVPKIGRLEKLLRDDPTPYDVVSLDFLGQMSPVSLRIARHLHTNRRALLLTNFLARREQKDIQSAMYSARSLIFLDDQEFRTHGVELIGQKQEEAEEEFHSGKGDLATIRSTSSIINFYGNLGFYRTESQLDPQRIATYPVHRSYAEEEKKMKNAEYCSNAIRLSMRAAVQTILQTMERMFIAHRMPPGTARINTFMAQALTVRAVYGVAFPMELKSYRYVSPTGNGRSPFESDFAVIQKPLNKYEEARRTVRFLLDTSAALLDCANADEPLPNLQMRDKNRMPLAAGAAMQLGHKITAMHPTRGIIGELTLSKLIQDLKAYGDSYKGNVIDRINQGETFEREEIE